MRNTLLLFVFMLSSICAFGQTGTSISYQDGLGSLTLNYLDVFNGKRRYRGFDAMCPCNIDVYWSGSRWEISAGSDVLYFSNASTALNPPNFSVGSWMNQPPNMPPLLQLSGSGTTSVLPVELLLFEGSENTGRNILSWQTASETNNQGFDIERSNDGVRFEKIGFVAGKGTTLSAQSYSFEDSRPNKGIAYYRLKQLDFDGQFEHSKIISIAQKSENEVSLFPNPSKGIFTVTGVDDVEDVAFTVLNSIGQTMSVTVQNNGQMDMSAFPSGLYYLRVAGSGQVITLVKE